MIRLALALAVTLSIAAGSLAQSAAEFGRATGGEIDVITKQPRRLSGSLGFSHGSRGEGYNATLGGSLLDERLWFFASAASLPAMQFASSSSDFQAMDAKVTAQPFDWSSISASFSEARPATATGLPSSFLSLRSTSMLSDNMILNFSFSTRKAGQP